MINRRVVRAAPDGHGEIRKSILLSERYVPGVSDDRRAGGDKVAVELVILHSPVPNTERQDIVPAQRFFDDGVDVDERVTVTEFGQAVRADDRVQLGLRLLLHFRVVRESEEEPFHRRKCLSTTMSIAALRNRTTVSHD